MPEWWRGATVYQIYPRSFKDSNGDGVGDLKGLIDGLDYVARLGVDAVWLSPFFTSPMRDFGYDVADHCGVDPVFGTLADFDALIERAHHLNLKVIIDQVYSHTSDRHTWFAESRRDCTNSRSDWYVWADPKADGTPPNNWQSVFGGSAWTWDARRRQYYFHNFLESQPDLNLHNEMVQDAILEVARFWLDRRVDGFRLDALNFAMHDPQLRDNPPAPVGARKLTRPFDYQIQKYSMSHPGIVCFLERLRNVIDDYGEIFTVAEVVGSNAIDEMKTFTEGERRLSSAYNFDFLYAEKLTSETTERSLSAWTGADGEGWPSWAFSNHDAPRAVSRWARAEDRDRAARLYLMLLLALRGNVFLYQGEELGLPQGEVPFEALQDPEAIANWPLTLGRDGARTPIPWNKGAPNAGFSTGKPWLPLDPRHGALAIDAQERDPQSMLNFSRKAIALRRSSKALRLGSIEFLKAPDGVVAFSRRYENEIAICAFNITAGEMAWRAPSPITTLASLGETSVTTLSPYSGYVARAST
jgi:alpha-glucosidase